MLLNVYSIIDEKAKCYSAPFVMPHNGQALRAFGDLVQDKTSAIAKHPGDYRLYKLATWDDHSGQFSSSKPEFLAAAIDFIETLTPTMASISKI